MLVVCILIAGATAVFGVWRCIVMFCRQMALTNLWLPRSKLTVCKYEVVTFVLVSSLYLRILGVNVINCSAMFASLL